MDFNSSSSKYGNNQMVTYTICPTMDQNYGLQLIFSLPIHQMEDWESNGKRLMMKQEIDINFLSKIP